jgi:hypothetical protein
MFCLCSHLEADMADGATWVAEPAMVADILKSDDVLVARCEQSGCGAEAVVSVGGGLSSMLRRASIRRLEEHLRCACGARRGRLSVRPYWGPRPAMTGRIFLFLA